MSKTYAIVLTGGIASGKSTVAKYIASEGYELVDSDKLVHEAYKNDDILISKISDAFGYEIISEGYVDRNKLIDKVIDDDKKLRKLNSIVHLRIIELLIDKVEKCTQKYIFLDVPLMFEVKEFLDNHGLKYDEIWYVYLDEKQQVSRLKKRTVEEGKNIDQVMKILSKQMSSDIKKTMADEIIDNTNDLATTYKNIDKLLRKLDER